MRNRGGRVVDAVPVPPLPPTGDLPENAFPLSSAQQGMWFAQQLEPSVPVNIAQCVELVGELDAPLLSESMITAGRELGSAFLRLIEVDGVPYQVVDPTLEASVRFVDLLHEPDPRAAAKEWMRQEYTAPIDVFRDRLVFSALLRIAPDRHYWYSRVHHVALDGMGSVTLVDRAAELYTATVRGVIAAPSKAADLTEVAGVDHDYRTSARYDADRRYWSELVARIGEPHSLVDRTAPARARSRTTGSQLPGTLVDHLDAAVDRHASSVAFEVIAAFAAYLARMTGREDVALSLPVTARTTALLRRSGGMVSNVVPLRLQVRPDMTSADLVAAVRLEVTAALRHQRYPHIDIRRDAAADDQGFYGPLINVMLFHNEITLGDIVGRLELLSTGPISDLAVNVYHGVAGTSLNLDFEANPDLYSETALDTHHLRFTRFFGEFLTSDALRPGRIGDLGILDEHEHRSLVPATGRAGFAPVTLPDLLAGAVRSNPDGDALVVPGTEAPAGVLSYRALDETSNQLARLLIDLQVGPEVAVALALPRSLDSVSSVWAVAKTGAAFVPVDPRYPRERILHMLQNCGAPIGITTADLRADLPDCTHWIILDDNQFRAELASYPTGAVVDADRTAALSLDHPAYVIYTSGSTGRPKGVAVTHRGLVNLAADERDRLGVTPDSRALHFASPSFDASVFELVMAVCAGAALVIAPTTVYGGDELAEFLSEQHITHAFCTPAALASLDHRSLHDLRTIVVAGDVCPPELVARWAPGRTMINAYGPSETTIMSSATTALTAGQPVSIGAPTVGVDLVVLDHRLRPVPAGVRGELYVLGASLARGYVHRAGLTAERFVACPFGTGGRMYRTGDVVRWVSAADGTPVLDFLGRSDHQVKIRGFRIELGEIDAALSAHPLVEFAHTIGHEGAATTRLVSYVLPAPHSVVDTRELAEFAGRSLPAYMVPSAIMVLDSLPLTPAGKLDRNALPAPVFAERSASIVGPRSGTEEVLAGIFRDVLGVDDLSVESSFFELGGNSLMATQVVSRVGAALKVRIGVRDLFESPSVAQLAVAVAESTSHTRARPVLRPRERPDRVPLSVAQQRMWFLNQFDPASPAYNLPIALRLTGDLDHDALRWALTDVAERHETLRTIFPDSTDGPHQVILPSGAVLPPGAPVAVDADSLTAAVASLGGTGFDLTTDPPLRVGLFREATDRHLLVLVVHHIAADGWSMTPLAADVMVAYAARAHGQSPSWAPLPVQYADYTLWQRDMLGSEADPDSVAAQQLSHWQGVLSGLPQVLDLPTDRPRPAQMSHRGGRVDFTVPALVHEQLTQLAHRTGTTPFMVTHAVLAVLLHRLGAGSDIVIGTPIAGRGEEELDHLVGMFVNTLVLRISLEPDDTFADLLGRVRTADLAAFSHGDVPFERLVEVLSPERSSAYHPLFQVMLSFQNTATTRVELDGLTVEAAEIDVHMAKFDLQLTVVEHVDAEGRAAGMSMDLSYATDLFDERTIVAMGARFRRILDAVLDDDPVAIGDIDLLEAPERAALDARNATDHPVPPDTLVSLFAAGAAAAPDAVALIFEDEWLTYAEFDERSNRLAHHLVSEGVGPESVVAVGMRRSLDLMVAIYAILKAGAAYLPVDPDHPVNRTTYVLETSRPVCLLTRSTEGVEWVTDAPVLHVDILDLSTGESGALPVAPAPEHAAYVIFTSGSTGRPKGVVVTHGAIVNRLLWAQDEYALTSTDAVLQKTPVTFDVSVWELFWPLQVGATLVIAAPDGHRDPEYLATLVRRHRVTVMHFVPSMLSVFTAEPSAAHCDSLRMVICSGEALTPDQAAKFRAINAADLHNLYGPTEAAVDVTFWRTSSADTVTVPIGRPVWNTRLHVLDARLHPVPDGVAGELYLAGAQLARGYLRRADLTADRFIADPFAVGARMYRTGDLVRRRPDGAVEYLGRTDFQVKLRGQRIELGEIESAYESHPDIRRAVVTVHRDDRGQESLVAYVVGEEGVNPAAVREHVSAVLPSYMIPAYVVTLDGLPLSANGKLDRAALPAPVIEAVSTEYVAPRTAVEIAVAEAVADVLDLGRVGLTDNFFELGGNSLVATRLVSRLRSAADLPVSLRDVFDAPTVGGLAQRFDGADRQVHADVPMLSARARPERVPLSSAQQRVWFLNQFDTGSPVHNLPLAVRFSGDLDVAALGRAVYDVVERHESLRTVFPDSGTGPWQRVLAPGEVDVEMTVTDADVDRLDHAIRQFVLTGFDVTTDIPVRARLFRTGAGEHVLALVLHHIAADGWSFAPLSRDVMIAYAAHSAGHDVRWSPLSVQYADYTLWQREVLGDEDDPQSRAAQQLTYWDTALAGLPDSLDLPTDRPRPAAASQRGSTLAWNIPADLHERLVAFARTHNVTLFMVAHSALALLLSRLSASRDIAIGTPVAGRGDRELDDLVGMFVNTLVLRTEVDPAMSFTALLNHVREVDLGAFGHAEVPFERLVEHLDPTRTTAHHPLFQVALFFQNHAPAHLELPGLSVSSEPIVPDVAAFDLQLVLTETHDGGRPGVIGAQFNYAADLFDDATIHGFAAQFVRILDAVTAEPGMAVGDVAITDPAVRARELTTWNATDHFVPAGTLPELFGDRVVRSAGAVAVVFEGVSLTYAELGARANRLARYLIGLGVGPESRVVLAMRRSLDLVVGMYAVLGAGGAYVPVDPDHPAERIGYVLDSAGPVCVLSTAADRVGLPAGVEVVSIDEVDVSGFSDAAVTDAERVVALRPENPAYVIFTSGSTGKPKGVAVPHAGIVNQLRWMQAEYGLTGRDVVLQKTATTFDVSVWGYFWPLQVGARLVLATADGHRDPGYLAQVIDEHGVTVTDFVPSMLDVFVAAVPAGSCRSLRHVFAIGEALPPETVARFRAVTPARLHNLYGPTEAAVSVTFWECGVADTVSVPIGVPEWNTQAYVLDSRLHPVPAGVAGSCISVVCSWLAGMWGGPI
nr:non-ribosomal peptide synthetase [Rhodococcus sp. USK13]